MDHAGISSHGHDTGPYGNRHWEIYDSQFLFANLGDFDGSKTIPIVSCPVLCDTLVSILVPAYDAELWIATVSL